MAAPRRPRTDPGRLAATLDHVAVAVPDIDEAERRWRDRLGGARVGGDDNGVFAFRQLSYPGGGVLELLFPSAGADEASFLTGFLERFGAQVHHCTLMVPALDAAVATLRAAGLDVVDVDTSRPEWHEAFLRPSQVGGLVVQVAWSPHAEAERPWLAGFPRETQRPGAARLLGPTLGHPDLAAARALWRLLGADARPHGDGLRCTWPDSPLDVVVVPGDAGPVGLRMQGAPPLAPAPGVGPAVLPP